MKKQPRNVPKCKQESKYHGSKKSTDECIDEYNEWKVTALFRTESRVNRGQKSAKSVALHEGSVAQSDDYEEPISLSLYEDEYCSHPGCSVVYNVQESCLERPSFVMESVPHATYVKLAPIFGMDPNKTTRSDGTNRCKMGHLEEEDKEVEEFIHWIQKEMGFKDDVSLDARVEVGTLRASIRDDLRAVSHLPEKPYRLYLKRTRAGARKGARYSLGRRSKEITQTVWQLESLSKLSGNILEKQSVLLKAHDYGKGSTCLDHYRSFLLQSNTKRCGRSNWWGCENGKVSIQIIKDFLEWYKSIGVEDEETTVDETILQDLFQIGFDSPTARAMALRIKEMPVVPESLAYIRNEPEFATKKGLKTLVKMDIKLEQQPAKLYAFGRMLPKEEPCLRFQPPKNDVKKTWTECERVPAVLESLQVVWEGIENLRSTIAFSNWLKHHPDIAPPGYLKEKGLLDINYEEWMQIFKGFEKEVDSEGADAEARKVSSGAEKTSLHPKPNGLATVGSAFSDTSMVSQARRVKSSRIEQFSYAPSSSSLNWKG